MMRLSQAATALNTIYPNSAKWMGEDVAFDSVGTDSRTIQKNQLFVALKGEKFDGHQYAEQAIAAGAAAVMVNADSDSNVKNLKAALIVQDTYQALGHLSAFWRSQLNIPVIAVTGSNGKTSVKEMLASILKVAAGGAEKVLATQGNLNNHIGVPLTLLKINPQHDFVVVEMGMNHSGEIAYLTQLAKPTVAIINNAGNAHLGELGSYEAIANAKGEILEGLNDAGTAVLNADDVFYPLWKNLAKDKKIITFGLNQPSDVTAAYQLQDTHSEIQLKTLSGEVALNLPVPGLHNVMNALAASAAALAVGISLSAIGQGLAAYQGAKGRLQSFKGFNGALVIDDTYNANPMSMKVAIDVLSAKAGKKILVLGDMGELGKDEIAMHEEVGVYAKNAAIDALFTLGKHSAAMTLVFGEGAKHYESLELLVNDVKKTMQADTTVLVKGSRFMAMERIAKAIIYAPSAIVEN